MLIFKLFFILLAIRIILFWVYIWQLKEYRLKRFLSDYGFKKILFFYLFTGGRSFYYPKKSLRSFLIILISLLFCIFVLLTDNIYIYLLSLILLADFICLLVYISWLPNILYKKYLLRQVIKKRHRLRKLKIIGITGSFGKSSTKEILAQLLSSKFIVEKTPLNINSEIGVAKYFLNKDFNDQAEYFIVEIGAYMKGEIKKVASALSLDMAILTAISPQHVSLFGSLEKTKEAKYELIESLKNDGIAYFNKDNPGSLELSQKFSGKKILYDSDSVIYTASLSRIYKSSISVASLIARGALISQEQINRSLDNFQPTKSMLNKVIKDNGAIVILDLYSSNPDGVYAAIKEMIKYAENNKKQKYLIMPCLIELGDYGKEVHQKIGKMIIDNDIQAIILNNDHYRFINPNNDPRIRLYSNIDEIYNIRDKMNSESIILLEGRIKQEIIDIFK